MEAITPAEAVVMAAMMVFMVVMTIVETKGDKR